MNTAPNPLLFALLGDPVSHSVSPAMQSAALTAKNLDGIYLPIQVGSSDLRSAVRGLAALGFRGANITLPHKETILPMLDAISDDARTLGAVNTIVIDRDSAGVSRIVGHNTDHLGVVYALEKAGHSIRGSQAIVIGAGGAARAAVFGLIRSQADEIVILARRADQGARIVRALGSAGTRLRVRRFDTENLIRESERATLLIHATPIGMRPKTNDSVWPDLRPIPPHLTVFDVVYTPTQTKLVLQAKASGVPIVSGLEMLIRQAAQSFLLWTDREAPVGAMRDAAHRALEEAV